MKYGYSILWKNYGNYGKTKNVYNSIYFIENNYIKYILNKLKQFAQKG